MPIVLSEENILLAYRNIKNNSGSNTPGTDGLTIKDIERFTSEEVIAKVRLEVSGRSLREMVDLCRPSNLAICETF